MKITGKRAEAFRYRFMYDEGISLFDVYKNPSDAKIRAFDWCCKKCADMGGYNMCIMSHNAFGFTVGWITEGMYLGADGELYSKYTLHVETPRNFYEMEY